MTTIPAEAIRETIYDKVIGCAYGQYYILHKIESLNGKKYIGSSVARLISEEQLDEIARDWDSDDDKWRECVWQGDTRLGADEWHDRYRADIDVDELIEQAPRYAREALFTKLGNDGCYVEEVSGECFHLDIAWEKLYEPNLWQIIKSILKEERDANNPR